MSTLSHQTEKEYFREKENFVLGFVNEEHLHHYLNYMFCGRSVRSVSKLLHFAGKPHSGELDDENTLLQLVGSNNYGELFFKEFYCKEDVLCSVLEKEIFRWGEWIEKNSEFHVLFAVLAKDAFTNKSECYFLLREDREREDFIR